MNRIQLKDIAESQTGPFGSQLHEYDYVEKGTPIVTVEHLGEIGFTHQNLPFVSDKDRDRLKKYLLQEGDIVFSRVGSVDRNAFVSKEEEGWLFSGRCIRVRIDKSKADPRFISFYFRQKNFKAMMLNISVGATMPSLNTSLMDNLPLTVPNLESQTKIAEALSALDEKIKINNRINAELETLAKTIYDYWFMQFDFPNKKGKPYKASGGKMVWSGELKREVPMGWEVKKLAEWIQADKNGDWGQETEVGNYTLRVNCVRGTDINGLNGLEQCDPPLRYILEKNSNKILNPFDLIIEISGGSPIQSTGRLAFLTEETLSRFSNPLICSNFCKAITLKNPNFIYNFVYYWQLLYRSGVFFGYEGKTSGIKNLLFESFVESHWTVVPDEGVAKKFYGAMTGIQRKKQAALKENQKLTELRDWLLPMLMNGQIKIKDAERELAMAAESKIQYAKKKA